MERCSWARSLIRVFKARLRLGPSLSGVNAKGAHGCHGGQRRRQGEDHQVSKLHGRKAVVSGALCPGVLIIPRLARLCQW
jgi:hypothetical protein